MIRLLREVWWLWLGLFVLMVAPQGYAETQFFCLTTKASEAVCSNILPGSDYHAVCRDWTRALDGEGGYRVWYGTGRQVMVDKQEDVCDVIQSHPDDGRFACKVSQLCSTDGRESVGQTDLAQDVYARNHEQAIYSCSVYNRSAIGEALAKASADGCWTRLDAIPR